MKKIEITSSRLTLRLEVLEDGRIVYDFLGFGDNNFLCGPKTKRALMQIETSDQQHNGHHALLQTNSSYSTQAHYVSHSFGKNDMGQVLDVVSSDGSLEITSHFQFYEEASSFTLTNRVKNVGGKMRVLEMVSSVYLYGFGQPEGHPFEEMFVHYADNSWHCEAQWKKRSFFDEGIYNGNDLKTMKHFVLQNVGSWSTKDHLPMLGIENERSGQFILGEIEHNGSWHMEIGHEENRFYLSMTGPEWNDAQWKKNLKPGEIFETVPGTIVLSSSFEESIQEITKVRRAVRLPSKDIDEMPVIYNDYMHALWDRQSEELIEPLIQAAKEAGCDEFVIDAGWFAPGVGWWEDIGEWKAYEANFPHGGLKGLIDRIHAAGMKAGLWFEIENVGQKSLVAEKLSDDAFFLNGGNRVNRFGRYCLNFDNPKVYDWALKLLSRAIEEYGLDYIKNDYNLDAGVGTDAGYDSMGDGLLSHNRAFLRFLEELSARYPDLTIENCGSGGCRMDGSILRICPIQSTSDQTDYRKYPYLSANVLTAVAPEQAAVWSYPVNKQIKEIPTDEVVAMNMVNAMLGRIHLASYINELTPVQKGILREGLAYFRSISAFKKTALPVYPKGTAHFFDAEVCGGLSDGKKMILAVWNTSGQPRDIEINLSRYGAKKVDVVYPLSLKTSFTFDEDSKALTYHDGNPYSGRVFEVELG